ncbi:MAG: c-type cytochrome [Acidobacteriota bacterium]
MGGRLYKAYCSCCHGSQGEGGEGPMLRNPVLLESATDRYFVETVTRGRRGTSMEAFSRPSTVRPALSPEEVEAIAAFLRSWEDTKP